MILLPVLQQILEGLETLEPGELQSWGMAVEDVPHWQMVPESLMASLPPDYRHQLKATAALERGEAEAAM